MKSKGFTLIELLVTIAIIAILVALSLFALRGVREQGRDARRKGDLEQIRSAVELYKADCNDYPAALSSPLVGDGNPASCAIANTYTRTIPQDPGSPTRVYYYFRPTATTYVLCAALENPPSPAMDLTGCTGAANCGVACNYKVTNP
ncbi:prepilin-type N-terminal cleavage/methylation domain-containing protein [Candidatus Woesebacteria bacterium]|nr:prepilin-type N-terminal cleavage/methylation domain-containing protein [Candidatus Woesebacteria bacterium]